LRGGSQVTEVGHRRRGDDHAAGAAFASLPIPKVIGHF